MVNSVNLNNSYGGIRRVSMDAGNRMVYSVIDSQGREAGKISVASKDIDTFERSYADIMEATPKIQKFMEENSTPEAFNKRKNLSRLSLAACGISGAVIPIVLTKNCSMTKKVISTVLGIAAGLAAGVASYLSISTPPGTFKFMNASKKLSNIDIQKVQESAILRATRM